MSKGPDPPSGGLAARIAFVEARALPPVAVLERENDAGGRFTIRPFGDLHRTFRPSACAVVSCGLAARPPVAGRAISAVAGATPQSEGLVRVRGEVEIHTSPLPPWGRSRTNNPWREGRPNAALGMRRMNPILLRLPPLPQLHAPLSCQRPIAWSLAPATHGGHGPDTVIRVCPYATAPAQVSPPVHGDRRFDAAIRFAESRDARTLALSPA